MNLNISKPVACALSAAGGAIAGAVATYFVTKKRMQKKNEEAVAAAVDDILDTARNLEKELASKDAIIESMRRQYCPLSQDPVTPEDFEADLEPVEAPAPEERPGDEMDIYAVTASEFIQDVRYGKHYMTYYQADGILADENENAVDDISAMIGDMSMLVETAVGGTLYIRNERTGDDYQIDFLPSAFRVSAGDD